MDEINRRKTLLIVNPKAGKLKTKRQLFDVTDALSSGGHETTVYTTTCRGDATRFARELSEPYDAVICRGGDGTLNEVITGIMALEPEKRPPIGFIPSGSTNDFAKSLNISSNSKKSVKQAMMGEAIYHDIGRLNKEKYFNYICCFGAFTELAYKTSQAAKNLIGNAAYFSQFFKALSRLEHNHIKVTIDDDEVIEDDIVYGAVCNTRSIAGVLSFDPEVAKLNDGYFEVLLVKFPKNVNVFNKTSKCLLTKDYNEDYVYFRQASKVMFEFEREVPWTTDGEFGGKGSEALVENIHNAVKIIR